MGREYIGHWKQIDFQDEYIKDETDERMPVFLKGREDYDCDPRECWNLDHSFHIWLLKHLYQFIDDASEVVDLHYLKFTFKGREFDHEELIKMMIERLEFYFSEEYDDWNEDDAAYVHEVVEIWSIVLRAMWW